MNDEIIKVLTLLVVTLSAMYAKRASKDASQANDAVNHRHDSGTPRLYDLALRNDERTDELIEWKRGYDGGPLDSGQKVASFMEEFENIRGKCCTRDDCPGRNPEEE